MVGLATLSCFGGGIGSSKSARDAENSLVEKTEPVSGTVATHGRIRAGPVSRRAPAVNPNRRIDFSRTTAMCKFDQPTRLIAAVVGAAVLLASFAASAGVVEDKAATATAKATEPARGYLLRCWQEGRLIVEEKLSALPASVDLTAAKLKALDTDNQAVYVTETKNATCLIRARFAEHTRGPNY
jgi:hypothetical protein